ISRKNVIRKAGEPAANKVAQVRGIQQQGPIGVRLNRTRDIANGRDTLHSSDVGSLFGQQSGNYLLQRRNAVSRGSVNYCQNEIVISCRDKKGVPKIYIRTVTGNISDMF